MSIWLLDQYLLFLHTTACSALKESHIACFFQLSCSLAKISGKVPGKPGWPWPWCLWPLALEWGTSYLENHKFGFQPLSEFANLTQIPNLWGGNPLTKELNFGFRSLWKMEDQQSIRSLSWIISHLMTGFFLWLKPYPWIHQPLANQAHLSTPASSSSSLPKWSPTMSIP